MNRNNHKITLHPDFINVLFAYKNKVGGVFKDILGLYEINHFAISYINDRNELLTFSSTPALEFNLFSSNLWHFDNTYQASWFNLGLSSTWQALYKPERYDELYYLKQIKHRYPIGLSMAVKMAHSNVIYSLASHLENSLVQTYFAENHAEFTRMGEYCSNALSPLLAVVCDSERDDDYS